MNYWLMDLRLFLSCAQLMFVAGIIFIIYSWMIVSFICMSLLIIIHVQAELNSYHIIAGVNNVGYTTKSTSKSGIYFPKSIGIALSKRSDALFFCHIL